VNARSERAERYLKTLERRSAVSTAEVEAILARQDVAPFAPWLEFHERYGGYVERIGSDIAVWGIVHAHPAWLAPLAAEVSHEASDGRWYAACADVHPSYPYLLSDLGEFQEGPARSFDVHVERLALRWWFATQAGPPPRLQFNVKAARLLERIEQEAHPVEEASDEFMRHYLGEGILAIYEVAKQRWIEVLTRDP
jgi:hypothetical protein